MPRYFLLAVAIIALLAEAGLAQAPNFRIALERPGPPEFVVDKANLLTDAELPGALVFLDESI